MRNKQLITENSKSETNYGKPWFELKHSKQLNEIFCRFCQSFQSLKITINRLL